MAIDTERFRALRKAAGFSQRQLADELGVTPAAIQQIENGTTQQPRAIWKYAALFNVAIEYLQGETDDPSFERSVERMKAYNLAREGVTRVREIDVGYALGAGTFVPEHVEEEFRSFDTKWLRDITDSPAEKLFIGRGIGDSMMGTILDNDVLLIDRAQDRLNMQDRIWCVAYGELGMIKRLRRLPNGNVLVMSDNPTVENFEASEGELHLIGRVCWIGRKA